MSAALIVQTGSDMFITYRVFFLLLRLVIS